MFGWPDPTLKTICSRVWLLTPRGMSDIVERLRVNTFRLAAETKDAAAKRRVQVDLQAANEIDRLRSQLEELIRTSHNYHIPEVPRQLCRAHCHVARRHGRQACSDDAARTPLHAGEALASQHGARYRFVPRTCQQVVRPLCRLPCYVGWVRKMICNSCVRSVAVARELSKRP